MDTSVFPAPEAGAAEVVLSARNVAKVFVGPTTRAALGAEIRKLLDGEAG